MGQSVNISTKKQNNQLSDSEILRKSQIASQMLQEDKEIDDLWNKAVKNERTDQYLKKQNLVLMLPDGNTYKGEWFKNERHGQGQLFDCANRLLYEGEWKLGQQHGSGIAYYHNEYSGLSLTLQQKLESQVNWKCYTGQFQFSQFNGDGILEFVDGSCMYGNFENGYPSGMITYEDLQLNRIECSFWENGQLQQIIRN